MKKVLCFSPLFLAISGCNDGIIPENKPSTNTPPTVSLSTQIEVFADKTTEKYINAHDPDGDPLTYDLLESPPWVIINQSTGQLLFSPTKDDEGKHPIKITVSDGYTSQTAESEINVYIALTPVDPDPINHRPTISAISATEALVGKNTFIKVQAVDADGDTLTYSLLNAPAWASINSTTGIITLAPTDTDTGHFTFVVQASDGKLTHEASLNVIVPDPEPINNAPVISALPPTKATIGKNTFIQVQAVDADGDTLTYSLLNAPAWASINSATGMISLAPT
ncbi:TPA: putative Ig domain-containing protein, partial [Photobacterium damselae]